MPSALATSIQAYVSGQSTPEAVVALAAPLVRRQAAALVEAAAVDDVIQESLIELLGTADRLRRPEAAEAWLRLIVRKQAERHRRRLRLPLPLDLAVEFPSPTDGPEVVLLRSDTDAAVCRALAAAGDMDRRLLVLRYVGDWSDHELAELVGTTPGAIRKRLHDARRRLRPHVEHLAPRTHQEEPMTESPAVPYNSVVSPAELANFSAVPLDPAEANVLPTGVRVLDAVVPIRWGGTVDFRGPVGTGHLVVIGEIVGNLAALGHSALIAVVSRQPHADGHANPLGRLIEDPNEIAAPIVVVDASTQPAEGLRAGARLAAYLAGQGSDVVLTVDRVTADRLRPEDLLRSAGRTSTGSVTALRVAPHARDAEPAEAWPLDSTLLLSLDRMAMGIFPTVDVLASRSTLIERRELPEEATRVAHGVRQILAAAAALDAKLAQPFHVAEPYTGTPGVRVSLDEGRRELAALL